MLSINSVPFLLFGVPFGEGFGEGEDVLRPFFAASEAPFCP